MALLPASLGAAPESPEPAGSVDPKAQVAVVGAETVTAEEITSFGLMLGTAEDWVSPGPEAELEEYILTRLHDDYYTTVSVSDPYATVPLKYRLPSQRTLLQRELVRKIEQETQVTRPELERWYEQNVGRYVQPESIEAHHLFMEISDEEPTSAPDRVRQRMEQVKREADAGTSFAMLARRYSEAASGANGGYIGTVIQGRPFGAQGKPINPRLEEALFKLQPGEVSEIVQTSHGLHLLYVADRTTTRTPSLDDLITSGIAEQAVKSDKVTSAHQALIEETIQRHHGRIFDPPTTSAAGLTTATPAIEFGGVTLTVHDYEKIYGRPFTRAFSMARNDPDRMRDLFRQLLSMEAQVQAAVDAGIDQRPDIARALELLKERAAAQQRLQAIYAEIAPVSEEELRAEYEATKDSWRRPELEGWVITLKRDRSSTSPAAAAKAEQRLKQEADNVRARLDAGEDFEKVAREVSKDDLASSGGVVARHVTNQNSNSEGYRNFDQTVGRVKSDGEMAGPVRLGDDYVIVKLGKRHPGEPMPFEQIRLNLERRIQGRKWQEVRNEIFRQLEASGKVRYLPAAASFGKTPSGAGASDKATTAAP